MHTKYSISTVCSMTYKSHGMKQWIILWTSNIVKKAYYFWLKFLYVYCRYYNNCRFDVRCPYSWCDTKNISESAFESTTSARYPRDLPKINRIKQKYKNFKVCCLIINGIQDDTNVWYLGRNIFWYSASIGDFPRVKWYFILKRNCW